MRAENTMTVKKHYAILRVTKIKSFADLRAVGYHNTRAIPTRTVPGAAPPIERLSLTGPFDQRAKSIFKKLEVKFKKNQIIAVEILLTASPEWWAQASNLQKKEWIESTEKFLHAKFGKGLISIAYHTDESTPHIQAVALPLYYRAAEKPGQKPIKPESVAQRQLEEANAPKIWRLSYDELLGGKRDRLSELQTWYHSFVAHLGLERGEITIGKGIKHKLLKQFAQELERKERHLEALQSSIESDQAFLAHEENKLRDQIYNFRNEERDVDARLKALIKREEAIKAREAVLDAREANLTRREQITEIRERVCDNNDRLFADRLSSVQRQQRENDRQTQNTESQLREIAEREDNLLANVAELQTQKEKLEIFEQQLIWVSQIPSAKHGKATSGMEVPTPDDDSNSKRTYHKALNAAWSERLKTVAIYFMKDLARKARLKATINRLRKMMSEMRRKEVALNKREARLISGERRIAPLVKEAEDKLAAAANIKEIAEQSARQSILNGQSAQKRAEDAENQWRSAKRDLDAVNASIQGSEREVEYLRKKRENLATELSGLEAQNAQIEVQTKELRAEAAILESRRTQFEAQNRALIDERRKVDGDRELHIWERGKFEETVKSAIIGEKLVMGAVHGQISLQLKDDNLIVSPRGNDSGFKPESYPSKELPPWIFNIVDGVNALEGGIQQVMKAEIALRESRANLKTLHPEIAPKIEEQRKQDPVSVRKIFDQLSSGEHGRGW